jgi:hypothetical protein
VISKVHAPLFTAYVFFCLLLHKLRDLVRRKAFGLAVSVAALGAWDALIALPHLSDGTDLSALWGGAYNSLPWALIIFAIPGFYAAHLTCIFRSKKRFSFG